MFQKFLIIQQQIHLRLRLNKNIKDQNIAQSFEITTSLLCNNWFAIVVVIVSTTCCCNVVISTISPLSWLMWLW